jgi:hypothetical protein
VLDTNVAELSAVGRYSGQVRHAPWANPDGILTEDHLKSGSNKGVIGGIARYAVQNGFACVLAPSHFLEKGSKDSWFDIDLHNCAALRHALDAEGGKEIAIDYPLIIPKQIMDDAAERRELVEPLKSMPVDSLWFRVSRFGSDGTAVGTRKYINAVQDFHALQRPIVADGVGGLAGLAIVAFGGACALSFGVAGKERFNASDWYKPPKKGGGGGGQYSFLLPGIDKMLTREDADAIVAAPGGRRLAACMDHRCCPLGYDDTRRDPKGHFLRQRAFRCDALSVFPEPMRAQHYLAKEVRDDERRAKMLAKLKLTDNKLITRLAENADRLSDFSEVLGDLEKTVTVSTRSLGLGVRQRLDRASKDRR